jgi:hypothetical protein
MNIRLAGLALLIALGFAQCKSVEEKMQPCDPGKIYPAVYPPVCEPVPQRPQPAPCPKTTRLGLPYDRIDEANYQLAVPRCAQLFPVSPCLKVFAKVADYTYRAICGAADGMGKQEFTDWKDRSK